LNPASAGVFVFCFFRPLLLIADNDIQLCRE